MVHSMPFILMKRIGILYPVLIGGVLEVCHCRSLSATAGNGSPGSCLIRSWDILPPPCPPSSVRFGKERASARARGKVWYAAVNVAAQRLAKAEAAGLRAPMSHVHRRAAERLLGLCGTNGGVYVKLGQHLSQLDFILPNEFIEVLQSMLDQVRDNAWPLG